TKDLRDNVTRYAALGISEYFIFDVRRARLLGYRLAPRGPRAYAPIVPQGGAYACSVLGLDLAVVKGTLRFSIAGAALPETRELFERASLQLEAALARVDEEARLREEETRLREEETQLREEQTRLREEETRRREELEAKLAAALAEIERLKRER